MIKLYKEKDNIKLYHIDAKLGNMDLKYYKVETPYEFKIFSSLKKAEAWFDEQLQNLK